MIALVAGCLAMGMSSGPDPNTFIFEVPSGVQVRVSQLFIDVGRSGVQVRLAALVAPGGLAAVKKGLALGPVTSVEGKDRLSLRAIESPDRIVLDGWVSSVKVAGETRLDLSRFFSGRQVLGTSRHVDDGILINISAGGSGIPLIPSKLGTHLRRKGWTYRSWSIEDRRFFLAQNGGLELSLTTEKGASDVLLMIGRTR